MTADGPVWGWASDSISSNLSARQWMYASAREDGIYTTTMQTQGPASGFERELPANLVTGQPTETTVDAVVFDQDGSEYPARLTTVTTATLLDSLALTRFEVADVLMVERSHRYVLQDRPSPGAVLVAQDMAWYGRGVGLVKSETGGLVSMGEPMPVLEIVELRGFRSPAGNYAFAELVLDAFGNAPDTTLRTVPTSPPQSLGGGLREWPGAQDLGRYSGFISLAPGNRIVLSESGARAVIHGSLPEEWTSPDAALTWSLLIPERDGW